MPDKRKRRFGRLSRAGMAVLVCGGLLVGGRGWLGPHALEAASKGKLPKGTRTDWAAYGDSVEDED